MAKGKIEQDIVLKVTGAQDVKDAAKLIDELDGKTAEVDIKVDSDTAETDVKKLTTLLHGLSDEDRTIVLKAQANQAEREIKRLTDQLGRAKDPETIKVKVELLGNARQRRAELERELKAVDAKIDVTADTDQAKRELDKIDRQADALDRQKTDIEVTADTSRAESALTRLRTQGTTALGGLANTLKANLAGAALGVGAAITTFAVKAIGDFQDVAIGAGELRDALGVTAEEASRLQEVAGDIGIGVDTLETAIGKMNRTAASTPGLFDAIGAELARNKDGTINVTETFLNAVDALNKIPDATQRAAAAQQIFGRGWTGIAELIAAGADDVREALESVEAGKLMDDEDIARGREFRDMLDEVKGVAEEASIRIGSDLVDSIEDVKTIVEQVKGPFEDFNQKVRDLEDDVPGGHAGGNSLRSYLIGIAAPATQIPRLVDAAAGVIRRFKGETDELVQSVDPLAPGFEDAGVAANNFEARVQGAADAAAIAAIDFEAANKEIVALGEALMAAAEELKAYNEATMILAQGATIESAVSGASALFDELFGLQRIASYNEAAFDALGTTLEENGYQFDLNTDKGRANQQVLEGLAQSLVPQIAASYAEAGGSFQEFARSMEEVEMGVFAQLREETNLTDDQIRDVIDRLGIFDGSKYQAQFELLGMEDAENKLALLLPLLDALNLAPDIEKDIALHVLAGDPQAALDDIQEGIDRKPKPKAPVQPVGPTGGETSAVVSAMQRTILGLPPLKVPSKVGTPTGAAAAYSSAQRTLASYGPLIIGARIVPGATVRYDAGGTVTGDGGIAGERGPEILDGKYLTAGPTYVPPGTRVTSRRRTSVILNRNGGDGLRRYDNGGTVVAGPRTINVNVNAAVVGNRFDVARAMVRGIRDIDRLMGSRG